MVTFYDQFQSAASIEGSVFDLEMLEVAASNVSTAQFPVNHTRVASMVKSIVKDNNLWVAPVVAVLNDEYYLVSGRHRLAAIIAICKGYKINNVGKLVGVTPDNVDITVDFESIVGEVVCQVVTVIDRMALNSLIVAYNGSRNMTVAEKTTAKIDSGTATKLTATKLAVSQALRSKLSFDITQQTALQFVGSLYSPKGYTPQARYATEEQVTALLSEFAAYLEQNKPSLPENLARNTGEIWYRFIVDRADTFNAAIPAKETVKRESAITKAETVIEQLRQKLLALGVEA